MHLVNALNHNPVVDPDLAAQAHCSTVVGAGPRGKVPLQLRCATGGSVTSRAVAVLGMERGVGAVQKSVNSRSSALEWGRRKEGPGLSVVAAPFTYGAGNVVPGRGYEIKAGSWIVV